MPVWTSIMDPPRPAVTPSASQATGNLSRMPAPGGDAGRSRVQLPLRQLTLRQRLERRSVLCSQVTRFRRLHRGRRRHLAHGQERVERGAELLADLRAELLKPRQLGRRRSRLLLRLRLDLAGAPLRFLEHRFAVTPSRVTQLTRSTLRRREEGSGDLVRIPVLLE